MQELERELKQLLIEVLNLEDISVEQIDSEAPLFGDGLGLDSIDALEFGIAIRKKYDVKWTPTPRPRASTSPRSRTWLGFVSNKDLAWRASSCRA